MSEGLATADPSHPRLAQGWLPPACPSVAPGPRQAPSFSARSGSRGAEPTSAGAASASQHQGQRPAGGRAPQAPGGHGARTAAKRGFHHGTCSALGGGLNPAAVTSWPCPARHFTAPSLRLHLRKRRGEATPLGTVTQITYTVTCGDRYHDTETRSTVSTQTFACVGKTTVRVGLKLDKKGQRRVCKSKRNEPVQDGSEGLSRGRAARSGEQVAEKPKLGARECRTPAEGPTMFHTRERGPLRGELARRALE